MISIVKPCIDSETVEILSRLLRDAKEGRVLGLAYVALHPANQYSGDLVGIATDSPLLARGLCRALEDTVTQKKR
jgi:hypothetical protein